MTAGFYLAQIYSSDRHLARCALDIRDIFDAIDRDNDHRLQLEEFKEGCALVLPELQLSADAAVAEFERMDDNAGGKLH